MRALHVEYNICINQYYFHSFIIYACCILCYGINAVTYILQITI